MKVEDVIREVNDLQRKLVDVDGLCGEYQLHIETAGDWWGVMLFGQTLVDSEDYEDCISLEFQIREEMKDMQNYLNLVLKEDK